MTFIKSRHYLDMMQEALNYNKEIDAFSQRETISSSFDIIRAHYNKVYGPNYFKGKLKLVIQVEPARYHFAHEATISSPRFCFYLTDGSSNKLLLVSFELTAYPFCCGMKQMNGFSYNTPHTSFFPYIEELVQVFTDACVHQFFLTMGITSKRLMINFVECRSPIDLTDSSDIPEIENPNMIYPFFRNWAMKQKKYRASLMYNSNSGNIIHHAEVVI